jgi:tripartite ATP-independent transporter DctM subunit
MTTNILLASGGFALMFALMLVRVPIGVAMGIAGVVGFSLHSGIGPGLALLGQVPWSVVTDYNFSVIPMFVLMGAFASASGMSRDLFHMGEAWFGHRRGGLAVGSIVACGGFAAINGSAVATAATMSTIALPEMRKRGYHPGFAAGVIAAGGTLGIMIPPSVIFVLYGIMTETDIAKLFFAGVVPGLLGIVMYSITVQLVGLWRPEWVPRGELWSWKERFRSLTNIWPVAALFAFVLGGMYNGFFTTTEASGMGAMGALLLGLARRTLSRQQIMVCAVEALKVTASIFVVVIGAYLFGYFLTITQTTQAIVDWLTSLPIGAYGILTLILIGYFVLGALMDELAMILLTVPIVFPVMMKLGFDPVWFGVIIVMAVTLGMICPPVGINVFVINSIHRDISLPRIYAGVMPFIASDIIRLAILCAFPGLSLFLPEAMDRPMSAVLKAWLGW